MAAFGNILRRKLVQFAVDRSLLALVFETIHKLDVELLAFILDKGLISTKLVKLVPKHKADALLIQKALSKINVSSDVYNVFSLQITPSGKLTNLLALHTLLQNKTTVYSLFYETVTDRLIVDVLEKDYEVVKKLLAGQ
ncbi:MAG: hypothetical protein ACYCST_21170 [Acidimicrobiales bacterium]